MNIFITFALCASIAAAAPVSVPKVQASLSGITTYVGAITLDDTAGYKVTAPFGMTLDGTCSESTYTDKASCEDANDCGFGGGSGACNYVWTEAGFSGSFEAKTNDNPSCDGLKTITVTGSFKLNLPKALTDAIGALSTALGSALVPDISTLSDGFSITQEIDVSSLTADIDIPLSDKVGVDKQKILNLLGTDITFRIAISELRLFKKGVEIPLYIVVEVVKKSIMKLPNHAYDSWSAFSWATGSSTWLALPGSINPARMARAGWLDQPCLPGLIWLACSGWLDQPSPLSSL